MITALKKKEADWKNRFFDHSVKDHKSPMLRIHMKKQIKMCYQKTFVYLVMIFPKIDVKGKYQKHCLYNNYNLLLIHRVSVL